MGQLPFLLILLLLVALLFRFDFVFYIVYVCFGVYALARWGTARGLRTLKVQRHYNDHAFLDEEVTVELNLHNPGRLPIPWLMVSDVVPIALHYPSSIRKVVSLGGRGREVIGYTLDCRRRGYYPLGPLFLNSGDLFGFAEAERRDPQPTYLTVYPQIVPLNRLGLPSKSPFGTIKTPQQLYEDPARTVGVRDYRPGDTLRRVHWKASARQRKLLVRTFEPAISLETVLFLDLNLNAYTREYRLVSCEWAIVVAASVANHLTGERQAVGLTTNGKDPLTGDGRASAIPPRPGRGHLMKVLELLARIEGQETTPLAQWIRPATHHLPWGTTIVAVTATGDEATCSALHGLVRMGFVVVLLAVEGHTNFGRVRARARQLGFRAYPVWDEKALRMESASG